MSRLRLVALVVLLAAGCDSKKPEGLPPAKDWQAPTAAGSDLAPMPEPRGAGNPHAGVPGAPPIGGGGGGADPHAGVPGAPQMGGGGDSVDVAQMGLPAPDPMKPVDPNKYLEGTVTVGPALAAKVPAGSVIFLAVRAADPGTGQGVGMPLATDKLVAGDTWPLSFKLDESKSMVGGTGFAGDIVIMARFDQDHEARSKQPGDIVGQVRATIPSRGLAISLDQVLP
jgi:hypothetical protein